MHTVLQNCALDASSFGPDWNFVAKFVPNDNLDLDVIIVDD